MKILFFLLCTSMLTAQELTVVETSNFDVDQFIGVDSYQHTYFIKDGTLHKEGNLGKFVFQDYQLGPISSVDIINPLNVVVFYAEVNTVVFLDNRLTEKQRINFNTLSSFINVSSATNAGNNRLWMFNTDTQQLQLFDYSSNRETVFSQPYEGTLLAQVSDFNDCLLLTNDTLVQINIYGSLLQEVPLIGFEKLIRNGKIVIGLKENQLFQISEKGVIPITYDFNENKVKGLHLTQDFLYIYHGNKLSKFTLTQPKQ